MISYRFSFLISVILEMVCLASTRDFFLFNESPLTQRISIPFINCKRCGLTTLFNDPTKIRNIVQIPKEMKQNNLFTLQKALILTGQYQRYIPQSRDPNREVFNFKTYGPSEVSKPGEQFPRFIPRNYNISKLNQISKNNLMSRTGEDLYRLEQKNGDQNNSKIGREKERVISSTTSRVPGHQNQEILSNVKSPRDNYQSHEPLPSKANSSKIGLILDSPSDLNRKLDNNAYPPSAGPAPLNAAVLYDNFKRNVDALERKFYQVSFDRLSSNSPSCRQENGISFAQSGLLLHFVLMALSAEVDPETRAEIEACLNFKATLEERKKIINLVLSSMPISSDELKLRWSSRLVLGVGIPNPNNFQAIQETMHLKIDRLNGTENAEGLMQFLNHLVELDSGGAMHDTFDEEELSNGVSSVLISMLYIRGRWRAAPTLLNGTRQFHDAGTYADPDKTFGAIRINDVIRYAEFHEWDAEAIEISYATPGLHLLILLPRGTSLRRLTRLVASTSVDTILRKMNSLRAAVTVPLYTLRMTLLLPSKLIDLGVSKLLNTTRRGSLKLSHAVQRLMFWSEAGRNAFKDDGIEWDDPPEMELVVDRPYIFFVRWKDLTLLSGNFVL